jgi:hypothetical protein
MMSGYQVSGDIKNGFDYFASGMRKYAVFSGRAGRVELWGN